ncbi:MAG: PEP/pyruvate-binding domain-containing protein, partial [candidate division Zixibacteria bacterium]|nr:PEP/pyruvate-binding domain-containing protein [candidate division Zixibacteria bacterium]
MNQKQIVVATRDVPRFDRDFFGSDLVVSRIGDGTLGGKASGLTFIKEVIARYAETLTGNITVGIPRMTVITSDIFERFITLNKFNTLDIEHLSDDNIALAFQEGELPAEIVGDLRGLIASVHTPLAIRSSSRFEDSLQEPLAGVYATKMIPNNQFDQDERFRKLVEAIKFVYASTWLAGAREYLQRIGRTHTDERMAVIIQEVVGHRAGDRFYPHVSGVARSHNFYPVGRAVAEQGVVNLALGLGKTIVDGSITWSYSPALPRISPPVASASELLKLTQTGFWAVNMAQPTDHDPIRENEYLCHNSLQEAEADGSLALVASTYRPQDDRMVPGIGPDGPRCVTFAPLLQDRVIPLNDVIKDVIEICRKEVGGDVEI